LKLDQKFSRMDRKCLKLDQICSNLDQKYFKLDQKNSKLDQKCWKMDWKYLKSDQKYSKMFENGSQMFEIGSKMFKNGSKIFEFGSKYSKMDRKCLKLDQNVKHDKQTFWKKIKIVENGSNSSKIDWRKWSKNVQKMIEMFESGTNFPCSKMGHKCLKWIKMFEVDQNCFTQFSIFWENTMLFTRLRLIAFPPCRLIKLGRINLGPKIVFLWFVWSVSETRCIYTYV